MTGRPTRRAVLATAGAATLAAACGSTGTPAPALTLPPDDAPLPTTSATVSRVFPAAAKAYFAPSNLLPSDHLAYGLNRTTVLPVRDERFTQMLRVTLPAAARDAPNTVPVYKDQPTYGGTRMFLPFKGFPAVNYYLRYYVRFSDEFLFTKGGFLPGFYGVIVRGMQRQDIDTGGFATRFAWRKRGAGAVIANTARPDIPVDVLGKGTWTWKPNTWICVEQGLQLNSVGTVPGSLLVWIDGVEVFQQRDFKPRNFTRLRIGGLLFQASFGDGDLSFAPAEDQTIDFAAFAVGRTRIGPIKTKKA